MKKINFIWIFVIPFMFSCVGTKLSLSGGKEKEMVTNLLTAMVNDGDMEQYRKSISPKFIKDNQLKVENYSINSYYPTDFKIESYNNETGLIVAKIWGESWAHRLTFKLVKEHGKLYFWPEKYTTSYIYPWYKVESYVTE